MANYFAIRECSKRSALKLPAPPTADCQQREAKFIAVVRDKEAVLQMRTMHNDMVIPSTKTIGANKQADYQQQATEELCAAGHECHQGERPSSAQWILLPVSGHNHQSRRIISGRRERQRSPRAEAKGQGVGGGRFVLVIIFVSEFILMLHNCGCLSDGAIVWIKLISIRLVICLECSKN